MNGHTCETTSSVRVASPDGTKYITVAKHSFPGQLGEEVWHPNSNGKVLEQMVKHFGDSDVPLCKLEPGLKYSQEPFYENTEEALI